MKAGKYLLDTNIVIAVLNGEPETCSWLSTVEVFLPVITLGELYFGAIKSKEGLKNLERVNLLAAQIKVLGCDQECAQQYGRIKEKLKAKGRPIPENDIWIAAIAIQNGLILATKDGHFSEIEGLVLSPAV